MHIHSDCHFTEQKLKVKNNQILPDLEGFLCGGRDSPYWKGEITAFEIATWAEDWCMRSSDQQNNGI